MAAGALLAMVPGPAAWLVGTRLLVGAGEGAMMAACVASLLWLRPRAVAGWRWATSAWPTSSAWRPGPSSAPRWRGVVPPCCGPWPRRAGGRRRARGRRPEAAARPSAERRPVGGAAVGGPRRAPGAAERGLSGPSCPSHRWRSPGATTRGPAPRCPSSRAPSCGAGARLVDSRPDRRPAGAGALGGGRRGGPAAARHGNPGPAAERSWRWWRRAPARRSPCRRWACWPWSHVPAERRGAAAGTFFAFFDVGVGAGGPALGVVAAHGGPAAALAGSAGAVLVRGGGARAAVSPACALSRRAPAPWRRAPRCPSPAGRPAGSARPPGQRARRGRGRASP